MEKSSAYRELQERHPGRLSIITAYGDGLKNYLETLKNRVTPSAKTSQKPKTNLTHRKFFNETRRLITRLYAQAPYDLDELQNGRPSAVAKYDRLKKRIRLFSVDRIASATRGTRKEKRELKKLLLKAYGRSDFTQHALSAAQIYGSPERAIKRMMPASRKFSPNDAEVTKAMQHPDIFTRPDHNLFALHQAYLADYRIILEELKELAQKKKTAA
ncbi:MAG: hypothetical protein V1708_01665 [Candidatus Micrarchaeota archaeon]